MTGVVLTFIEPAPGASYGAFALCALALIGLLAIGMTIVQALDADEHGKVHDPDDLG